MRISVNENFNKLRPLFEKFSSFVAVAFGLGKMFVAMNNLRRTT